MPTPILLVMLVVQDNALYHSSDNNVTTGLLWNDSYKINIIKFKSATCLRSRDFPWGSHISLSLASTVVFESRTHAIPVNDWAWQGTGSWPFSPNMGSSTNLDSQNSAHVLSFPYANFFPSPFTGVKPALQSLAFFVYPAPSSSPLQGYSKKASVL